MLWRLDGEWQTAYTSGKGQCRPQICFPSLRFVIQCIAAYLDRRGQALRIEAFGREGAGGAGSGAATALLH